MAMLLKTGNAGFFKVSFSYLVFDLILFAIVSEKSRAPL